MEEDASPQPQPAIKHVRWYYTASFVFSLACLIVIAAIWCRAYTAPYEPYPHEVPLLSKHDWNDFLKNQLPHADSGAIYIPTGVMIQSLQFNGPYNIEIAGYIWQRYSDSLPPLRHGVVFPEAVSSSFNQIYETKQDHETMIGWSFTANLREQFDYSKYPLDKQLVWIRMWDPNFEANVYLEPDLEGYKTLEPAMMPGVDPSVLLENWKLMRSYFSYRLTTYHANFGLRDYDPGIPSPELYFNVAIQRYILSPLVARSIAPLLILLQLFVIVLVIGSDSKRLDLFGVKPGAVIFTCAAFFFAVLIAENALRDEVKWYGIVYLESLHLITYFVILSVAANSVALVVFPSSALLRDDNLWVEVFYWPVILSAFLLITIATFS